MVTPPPTITRIGQTQGDGDAQELFLKVYAGMLMMGFARESVTNGRVFTKSITSGKSASFPLIGGMSASYLTPGDSVLLDSGYLSTPKLEEKVIVIDGILQTSVLIYDLDEAMAHYSTRAALAREGGMALAKEFDLHTLQTIVTGAGTGATFSSGIADDTDWSSVSDRLHSDNDFSHVAAPHQDPNSVGAYTTGTPTSANSRDTLADIARIMDEDNVPKSGRHVAVPPHIYYKFMDDNEFVSSDYTVPGASRGVLPADRGLTFMGLNIHSTNRIADLRGLGSGWSTGSESAEMRGTDYEASTEFDDVLAVAWQQEASVGVVRLRDYGLSLHYEYDRYAWLLQAGFSAGHGVLHQTACHVVHK